MNYIFNILSYPFKQYPLILLFIWVITTATDTIPYYETRNYIYCIHIAMDSFFFSYLIVLFTSFIKKNIIRKLFLNTFVFLYLIYNIINLYCIYILKHASIVNVASIIANSNSKEIQEFISHTISPINLLFCIIFFFIFICLLKIIYKAPIYPSHNNIYIGFLLLAISFITIANKPLILSEISYGKIILSIKTINETPPNFSTTLTNTQIEETHQYHPKNRVFSS